MHAYILVSQEVASLQLSVTSLAKKLKAKVIEFPLQKIDDVRSLNNLIRLSFDSPTLIVCQNIHDSGEEALNAFLKNLEEPQENVYFALTTPSLKKVLPTIISRCQIIRVGMGEVNTEYGEAEKFLQMTMGDKFSYIDKIKDREKAIELAENTVKLLHSKMHKNELKYDVEAKNLEASIKTYSRLKANGNVNLHLSNMAIKISNGQ